MTVAAPAPEEARSDDSPRRPQVHLFGVRHHGPGSARSVRAALDAVTPDIVLVELPADVQPALGWIGDSDLVPPVALLAYAASDPGRAAFAPLASFSPEWQALRWAAERDVEARPIDLPFAVSLAPVDDAAAGRRLFGDRPPDPLRALADAAGDPDPERWWEDVVEHRGDGPPAFDVIAEAMGVARAGYVPGDREARREAHMRRAIRAAVREGHRSIAVIVGAWHVPALDMPALDARGGRADAVGTVPGASADAATLRGMTKVKVSVAWVPWTHRRLASGSGYAAGVDSPGWYRHVFDHPGEAGVARFFVDAAHLLRDRGQDASPDHLIAGTRLATTLAALRQRPRPGLAEVLDAAEGVLGGIALIRRQLVVGDAIGTVPVGAPLVPLARDVARAQRSARLTPSAERVTLEVDLRTPTGLRKSHLLHRLVALGVPWGTVVDGRGTSGTFRETWELRWEPEWSIRLIEQAGYGTTLESAASARLIERAVATEDVGALSAVIELALFASLPTALGPAVDRLARRSAVDPDIGHLLDALPSLAHALRYGDVRGTDAGSLRSVVDGMLVRILAGLHAAARSLDDDAAALLVTRLASLQGALAVLDHPLRRTEFPRVLADLAVDAGHGAVQGRATRLLHDGGIWSAEAVQRRLSRALSSGTPPVRGAAFVEGFLAGSGAVLVHDADLLAILDGWIASLPNEAFEVVVALLRRTFGAFEPAERRQLMSLASGRPVAADERFGADVDHGRAAAAVATVRHMLGLAARGDADRVDAGRVDAGDGDPA